MIPPAHPRHVTPPARGTWRRPPGHAGAAVPGPPWGKADGGGAGRPRDRGQSLSSPPRRGAGDGAAHSPGGRRIESGGGDGRTGGTELPGPGGEMGAEPFPSLHGKARLTHCPSQRLQRTLWGPETLVFVCLKRPPRPPRGGDAGVGERRVSEVRVRARADPPPLGDLDFISRTGHVFSAQWTRTSQNSFLHPHR